MGSGTTDVVEEFEQLDAIEDLDQRWRKKEDAVNEATFDEVVRRQQALREAADRRIGELIKETRSSATWIRRLSLATFGIGIGLLVAAVAFGKAGNGIASLGAGGTGTAAILGTLFYRPMERINDATADLAQQETLLRTWSITVDLELMAADTFERETVREAADRLRRASRQLSRSVEGFVEDSSGETGRSAREAQDPGQDGGTGQRSGNPSRSPPQAEN